MSRNPETLPFSHYNDALNATKSEIIRAFQKHGPGIFYSKMEAFAVLKEEVDEMWHEVKHGTTEKAVAEAVQVCAMAARFVAEFGTYPYAQPTKPNDAEITNTLLTQLLSHLNKINNA